MPDPARPTPPIHLRGEGTSVIFELDDEQAPAVVHWGADLGELSAEDLLELARGTAESTRTNGADVPMRLGILPEQRTGWAGRAGVLGSRSGRDWSPAWRRTGVDQQERSVRFHLVDEAARLTATLTVELLTGGALRLRAELTNTGAEDYQLDRLSLALPVPERATEILDLAGSGVHERVPQRHRLQQGRWERESWRGRTGAQAATMVHLGTPGFDFADGEIWAVHTGWSGNHSHHAERTWSGQQAIGGGEELFPGEVRLAAGESYTSPWLYASHGRGLDEVAGRLHTWLRSRPTHPTRPRPVTLNVWEAVYFDHSLERLLPIVERAAEVGVERFVLDDGWFGARRDQRAGLGDWVVSPEPWPDGLGPLIDRVHQLGMEFGLWIEPEMVNLDSDIARAHPDWVMTTGDRLPPAQRDQQVLNLGIAECYDHVRDQLVALLDEYDIGYFKWDHNRDLIDAGTAPDGRPGVHAQTLACYRLMRELKEHQPGLEIESCASGGGRVDLGVMDICDRIWVSDNIDPHERHRLHRWSNQLLGWELLGSHIPSPRNKVTARVSDLGFRGATALFGHLGIEWDLSEVSDAERAEVAQWVALHKQVRDWVHRGRIHRSDPATALQLDGVVAEDGSQALYSLAQLDMLDTGRAGTVRLPGLDPDRRYRLHRVAPTGPRLANRGAPAWWGSEPVLSGRVWGSVGVQAPELTPDQADIWHLVAE
ncbi:alpha-galactosidase [Enemella evansiae]|uniref:alpha-galactosidase n=1 Tax=Enemella evansiae TaxID=2016499 RepID=UPI000B95F15B|nr:alpha-galactosidase [Enemella evansiae]OYN93465.1 alpha-galactosidase [Enemella evansiae]